MVDIFGLSAISAYGGFPKGFFYLAMGFYLGHYKLNLKYPALLAFISLTLYSISRIIYPSGVGELLLAFATLCILIACASSNGKPTLLSKLGKYTLSIYILHVLVYESIYRIYNYIGYFDHYLNIYSYIIVGILSVVIPMLIYKPLDKLFVNPLSRFIRLILN
jgi:peptidoglycan/LPS O-acetylase OafA/YrhL